MSKNKSKKVLHLKKSRKSRKSRKNRARGPKSSYYDNNKCCVCSKKIDIDDKLDALIPSACLRKNGAKAHRICQHCWFRPRTGFATEGRSHACPGCEKKKPLSYVKPKTPIEIDLTTP